MPSPSRAAQLTGVALFGVLLSASNSRAATCAQTLDPGADLVAAITAAAAGSTICLNAGTYPEASLQGVSKTSPVTIQSTSGRTASVSFRIRNSNHLRFVNLTISRMDLNNGSAFNTNISVTNNTFTGQMLVSGSGSSGVDVNILVDGNTFDGINICYRCPTGRLQLWAITGVTITNNHFGGGGTADGIQWGGYGGTVGPGNVFDGILQSAAGTSGAHIDSIQLNGGPADSFGGRVDHGSIVGNYFGNNTIHIMAPDGANAITVKDNVFTAGDPASFGKIQMGTHTNDLFIHNTLIGVRAGFDAKYFNPPGENNVVTENIMINSSFATVDSHLTEKCTNCTITHNLFSNPQDALSGRAGTNNGTNATSTNSIIGMPTFAGGAAPTTLAGYQLLPGSVGYRAALDGTDMGLRVVRPGSSTPAAPRNLRVQ